MQVYDTANQLAREIKESKEYKNYKEIKTKLLENPDMKEKLNKFEKTRYDVQRKQLNGEEIGEASKELENIYMELYKDTDMQKYFKAETDFNILITDVNKIIAEAIEDLL